MKNILSLIVLVLVISFQMSAQIENLTESNKVDELIGEWEIDLRPTPQSEGYFQPFIVESIEENTLKGTFYGSGLENALLNDNWDKLYFAFTTKDNSNEYYHTGYLYNGKLFGITYCPNRNFTAPWTGLKK